MNEQLIQEAVLLTAGKNYLPVRKRYRLPNQTKDASIYLLSNSFEYDIQMIKNVPQPKFEYKNIIIPYKIMDRICVRPFRYLMTQNDYTKKVTYINNQKLIPRVIPVKYPYPKSITENLYIPMSDVVNRVNTYLKPMSVQYIQDNIFSIFDKVMHWIDFSHTKELLIDTRKYPIYRVMSLQTFKTDLINAVLTAFMISPEEKIKRLKWIFVFRTEDADYKFDLSTFNIQDRTRLRAMFSTIGTIGEETVDDSAPVEQTDDEGEEDDKNIIDKLRDQVADNDEEEKVEDNTSDDDTQTDGEETDAEIKNFQSVNMTSTTSLKSSLDVLTTKYGLTENENNDANESKKLYNAKTTNISAQLRSRIPGLNLDNANNVINSYETISNEVTKKGDDNVVEDQLLDQASKKMATNSVPVNSKSVDNTTTNARETKIRQQVGRIKLNNVTFDTMLSVTDTPLPKKVTPLRMTTTSSAAKIGTGFPKIAKEYEDKLMDRDIVATFMNLGNLPNGFYIKDVQVTDISTSTVLANNWKVTLKNKQNDRQNVINVKIPKVVNGKFFNNGVWYNIGNQDFPIPVLKVDKKKVMLTTNYNKIEVTRYDTRSLVDVGLFTKLINKMTGENGANKYCKPGSSVGTNSRFMSTIEYDEYAKQWLNFHNKEANLVIWFDRNKCMKLYGFVTVKDNEFCCGAYGNSYVIINIDTGLTRDGQTLTELMLSTMSENVHNQYLKSKPGKLAMYTQIRIGEKMPLGVAIAAWEGMTSLIKKSNCGARYVDKNFNERGYFTIPFKDKSLAVPNNIQNQLLFNGFFRINTKAYSPEDFDKPISETNSVFVEIFNQHFFKQFSQLTLFNTYYDFFVDPMTKDVCLHYNIPDDLCGMLIYASNLLADNGFTAETNSSLYRVRSSEIIPAILHYTLAFAISTYNNSLGSKSRGAKLIYNPNEVFDQLRKVPTVETKSALNPFIEMHQRETVSRKGFRGVNTDRAYSVDKRSYNESMIGKIAISTPNSSNVGMLRQMTADPKLESVRGYTSTAGMDTDFNDLQLASFSELMTPGTVTRDDAIRNAIATSQTGHIVSTEGAQPVLISNGIDEIAAAYVTDEFAVMAENDGVVLESNEDYMIIQYKNNKKQAVPIGHRQSFNAASGFYVDNQLIANFQPGEKFKQNDILAYHKNYFSKDVDGVVRMNLGPLAKVAFMETYSTYEDAGMMTEKFSRKMATTLSMQQRFKINATEDIDFIVKVGDEVEIGDPLIKFGLGDTGDKAVDNFLKAFQSTDVIDTAKRTMTAKHAGKVVAVNMYTCKSMDKLSPSLYNLLSEHFKQNIKRRKILDKHDKSSSVYKLGTLYSLPTEPLKGSTIMGITTDVLIDIYIEHTDIQSVGDKAVAYGAMKQITSEIIPEGLEPYSESAPNEEISMFVNSSSILKRMVPSVLVIAAGNKVLIELKKQIDEIWNGNG